MEEEQLRQQIEDAYGVTFDERLKKEDIQNWLDRQQDRSPFPNARLRGQQPTVITPQPTDPDLELIKTRPILMLQSADRARIINRNNMATSDKIPDIGGDVPPAQILEVEDEEFDIPNAFRANAKKDQGEDGVSENEEELEEEELEEEELEEEEILEVPEDYEGYPGTLPRQGLLEQIQEGAQTARRINVQATFQPKTVLLPPPRAPFTKARIVTGQTTPVTGARGVGLVKPKVTTTQRTFELSKPGQRVTTTPTPVTTTTTTQKTTGLTPRTTATSPRVPQETRGETELTDFIDPDRITMQRGSYTVEQLRLFLGQLGLPKSGTKADLVARLRQAYGLE